MGHALQLQTDVEGMRANDSVQINLNNIPFCRKALYSDIQKDIHNANV